MNTKELATITQLKNRFSEDIDLPEPRPRRHAQVNWLWQEIEERARRAGVLLLRRPTATPSLSSREFGRWKMKCGEWTAGVREQSVFLPSSVNNITFSSQRTGGLPRGSQQRWTKKSRWRADVIPQGEH